MWISIESLKMVHAYNNNKKKLRVQKKYGRGQISGTFYQT